MKVSIIQSELHWESPSKNREMFDQKISVLDNDVDLIVLPEMFTTGFSMTPEKLAENSKGPTIQWLNRIAKSKNAAIAGSMIFEENGKYYNRLLFVKPDGELNFYDKRHLFSLAGENKHYESGNNRVIINWKGFRVLLLVCYDLRFPVWARNQGDYDAILIVANFPTSRILVWNALLQARAIENQSYVIACNRVGVDGNGINHCGDSQIIDPVGNILIKARSNENQVISASLSLDYVIQTRTELPFINDSDRYTIL